MSVYRFGIEIGRHSQQLYSYTSGKHKISPLLEEKMRTYFKEHAIEVVEKD